MICLYLLRTFSSSGQLWLEHCLHQHGGGPRKVIQNCGTSCLRWTRSCTQGDTCSMALYLGFAWHEAVKAPKNSFPQVTSTSFTQKPWFWCISMWFTLSLISVVIKDRHEASIQAVCWINARVLQQCCKGEGTSPGRSFRKSLLKWTRQIPLQSHLPGFIPTKAMRKKWRLQFWLH